MIVVILYAGFATISVFGLLGIEDPRVDTSSMSYACEHNITATTSSGAVQTAVLLAPLIAPTVQQRPPKAHLASKATAAIRLWKEDPLILLLAPIQIIFSMCSALLASYMTGKVVKQKFGHREWILFGAVFDALVPATAALLQLPSKWIASRFGRFPLMFSGGSRECCVSARPRCG